MGAYDDRPWLALYPAGLPADIEAEHSSGLEMWKTSVARDPDAVLIRYFDGSLTAGEVERESDAIAAAFAANGVLKGDRVALYMQNVPAYVLCIIAAWKCGAIVVPINPMNKRHELATLLGDSGAGVLVCHPGLYDEVARDVIGSSALRLVVTASELDYQSTGDERALSGITRRVPDGTVGLPDLLERHRGEKVDDPGLGPADIAFLSYTSGTTGPPKGAMTTHANVVFNAQTYRDWIGLDSRDVVLGVAPLFHITGLIAHVAVAMCLPATLVLFHRFEPSLAVDAIRDSRATFTVGSITVFIALMNVEAATAADLASLTRIYSGGAPIPPSVVDDFGSRFGHYIHNIYGLTETTSPSHAVPFAVAAPVDPASGALSVGIPVFNTVVRVVGDDGEDLPPGAVGEIVTEGPQVVAGYWQKPEETELALGGGRLRTGDVGFMDPDGWFYIVDRRKDQINVSGYKVWPREVEDVLYQHPAVREAAVVGVADSYRGETVKAVVSLRPGADVTPGELIGFCRDRMAAYKYPRIVEIRPELPKTASGKILRRELREQS
jgi:long-chain acyl-CoA synthetase